MSVAQAQREIDSAEFSEWQAYERVEPFGEARADLRSGIVASVMANTWRGKDQKAHKPSDFMPDFDRAEKEPEQSPEEMFARLSQFAAVHNTAVGKK